MCKFLALYSVGDIAVFAQKNIENSSTPSHPAALPTYPFRKTASYSAKDKRSGLGIQLQLTCTDKKSLLEAFENPEAHKNLIVRVGGYSEYFHRLPRKLQESIVQRSIYL